jgi:UTP--glucose-1-phosphate uridylyltransferase
MKKVTKAIIAAAGFGTRFLPQTKAMPKEMLPIVDKPVIQCVVEQLVEAGITDIIIVTGYAKRSIEDHFDAPNAELVAALSKGKEHLLKELWDIANMANFTYVRQKESLGNTAPLLYASHLVNDEPFIYTWGDEFVVSTPNIFKQTIDAYEQMGASILPCIHVTDEEAFSRYGFLAGDATPEGYIKMKTIIEKPGKAAAPSNLASVGGYLLTPDILPYVTRAAAQFDGKGELTIQPVMQDMIADGYNFYGLEIRDGVYYDTGNKLEYLKTVIDVALNRDDLGPELRIYLQKKLK